MGNYRLIIINTFSLYFKVFVPFLAELLTGSNLGNTGEQSASSYDYDDPISSFHFIRQSTLGEERQAECAENSQTANRVYPAQHSQSSPSIPAALNTLVDSNKEVAVADEESSFMDRGVNISPPRQPSNK